LKTRIASLPHLRFLTPILRFLWRNLRLGVDFPVKSVGELPIALFRSSDCEKRQFLAKKRNEKDD